MWTNRRGMRHEVRKHQVMDPIQDVELIQGMEDGGSSGRCISYPSGGNPGARFTVVVGAGTLVTRVLDATSCSGVLA